MLDYCRTPALLLLFIVTARGQEEGKAENEEEQAILCVTQVLKAANVDCEQITEDVMSEVVSRARDCSAQLERSAESDAVERHLGATIAEVRYRRRRCCSVFTRDC